MTIMKIEVKYGYDPSKPVTLRKWLGSGDSADKTGGATVQAFPDGYAYGAPPSEAGQWINTWLTCLAEVMSPDVQIFNAYAEQYDDTPEREIIHSKTYSIIQPVARTGNTPDGGPRGLKHLGGRQFVPATRRTGWLRWHFISAHIFALQTVLGPDAISEKLDEYYGYLRNPAGSLGPYYTVTSALATYPVFTPETYPSELLMQGIRNG